MPRMSKKRRLEWSFFLNHRNRITYNDLCRGCTHGCKQSFRAIIVLCPRYFSKRWKHREDSTNMSVKNRPETIPKQGYALHPIRNTAHL